MGIAPTSIIASTTAINVKDCVITSSPGLILAAFNATLIAAVPEDTQTEYFDPTYLLNSFSNSFTFFPLLSIGLFICLGLNLKSLLIAFFFTIY